jgi:hypothetical protein
MVEPRFEELQMTKLLVRPKEPPIELLGRYGDKQQQFKKAAPAAVNTELLAAPYEDGTFQESINGRVPNGLVDSRGFIVTESTAQAMQKHVFDEDTLDAWNRSRAVVDEVSRKRRELATAPFYTEDPSAWLTTYQQEHVNYLPAVQHDAADYQFRDSQHRGRRTLSAGSVSGKGELIPTNHAVKFIARNAEMDPNRLKETLDTERLKGIHVSKNGTTTRLDNAEIAPDRPKPKFVGGGPTTTSGTTYGQFDWSSYKNNEGIQITQGPDDEETFIRLKHERAGTKYDNYSTTHTESYQDQSLASECDRTYHKSHYFDRKANTQFMKRGHDPQRKDTNFQDTQRTTDIVPDQFTTTSMRQNNHFRHFA